MALEVGDEVCLTGYGKNLETVSRPNTNMADVSMSVKAQHKTIHRDIINFSQAQLTAYSRLLLSVP